MSFSVARGLEKKNLKGVQCVFQGEKLFSVLGLLEQTNGDGPFAGRDAIGKQVSAKLGERLPDGLLPCIGKSAGGITFLFVDH